MPMSIGSRASCVSNCWALRTSRSMLVLRSENRSSNDALRLSARTNEPTTNDTLAVMAKAMAIVRPSRDRMLRRASRAVDPVLMSLPVLLQAVEHCVGGRVEHLADDLAVADEHHPVGVRRRHRV